MRANVCYLDLSENALSELGLNTSLKLLELCSHKLCTLILDGSRLGLPFLTSLAFKIKSLGMTNLRKLSVRDCHLKCTCPDKKRCPMEPLTEIAAYSENLQVLDMALNKELSLAGALSHHLDSIQPIRRVNLSGAMLAKTDIEAVESYGGGLELFEEVGQMLLPPSMVALFRKSI